MILTLTKRTLCGPLVAAWALGLLAAEANADIAHDELRKFARQAVEGRWSGIREPRFKEDRRNDMLKYDLGGVDLPVSDDDPLKVPLRLQLRVEVIRKYRSGLDHREWRPYLRRVENIIAEMLRDIESRDLNGNRLWRRLDDLEDDAKEIFQEAMEEKAEDEDLDGGAGPGQLSFSRKYSVKLDTAPQGGTIEYVSFGDWELYKFLKDRRPGILQPVWTAADDEEELVGRYWFSVKWTDKPKQVEAPESIDRRQTITFKPKPL